MFRRLARTKSATRPIQIGLHLQSAMRTASALAAGTLFATAIKAQNGVVQWGIERKQLKPKLGKRAGSTFEEVITNEQARGGYFATCSVGTPAQDLTLQLDTGSSDIWVPYSQASVCQGTSGSDACTFGSCRSCPLKELTKTYVLTIPSS